LRARVVKILLDPQIVRSFLTELLLYLMSFTRDCFKSVSQFERSNVNILKKNEFL